MNYSYWCTECGGETIENHKYETRPTVVVCSACGGEAEYHINAPALMIKGAYRDGAKRSGWSELREAVALEKSQRVQKDGKEKARIANQIKKLGVKLSKD
jgi:predicted nucleic acid-binding Zn ribbon protein